MNLLRYATMIITVAFARGYHVPVNLSIATCYLPEEGPKLDLFMEWSNHHKNEKEGYCYDYHGNGFGANQTFLACEGCIVFTCISKPCKDRDGSFYKLWWELTHVDEKCCIDCKGRVIPTNKGTKTDVPDDPECHSTEHTLCVLNHKGHGELEVTFDSMYCCVDPEGIHPLNTTVLELPTCSERTCEKGCPATWLRHAVKPGCHCCECCDNIIQNGAWAKCNGTHVKCCDGELMIPDSTDLSHCHIENLVYLIDTSGSMKNSRLIWEPVALGLEEKLDDHQVKIDEYTLMDYVQTVSVLLVTQDHTVFEDAVANIVIGSGGNELTFAGIKSALSLAPHFSFIVLFSDEVGDDTTDVTLKNEIIQHRDQTSSTVVFMMIPNSEAQFQTMVTNFQDIGTSYDLRHNPNATHEVLKSIQSAAICTGITYQTTLKELCPQPKTTTPSHTYKTSTSSNYPYYSTPTTYPTRYIVNV